MKCQLGKSGVFSMDDNVEFVNNSIILFDEYLGYINWENHEFKAFAEFIDKNNFRYKYIGITDFQQVAVQIHLI
jgi:hypothetical protein